MHCSAPRGAVCMSFVSIAANLKTTTGGFLQQFYPGKIDPTSLTKRVHTGRAERETRRFRGTIIGAYVWNFFSCCHGTAFSHDHPIWSPTRTWATVINRKAPSEPRCRASAT